MKYVRSIGGVLLIVAGLLGLVFPVIPGVPLLLAGVSVLGWNHPLVRPAVAWLKRGREAWRAFWRKRTGTRTKRASAASRRRA